MAKPTSSGLSDAERKQILDSLTEEDYQILEEAFTVYDKNHDGTITTKVSFEVSTSPIVTLFVGIVHGYEISGSKSDRC